METGHWQIIPEPARLDWLGLAWPDSLRSRRAQMPVGILTMIYAPIWLP